MPHPTGFPLFDLAGHTLSRLPLAPAALRVHLLGTLCALAAILLLWRAWTPLPTPLWQRRLHPLLWLLPLTIPAIFLHVRATEVYPPTWLLCAATLWIWHRESGPRRLVWLALLAGLGAGVHVEAALVPALAFLPALWRTPSPLRLRALLLSTLLAFFALASILYLPLAALRRPAFSWGDVRTLPALWDHLTAASIRGAFADRMGGLDGFRALAHLLWQDARLLAVPALLGAWDLHRRREFLPIFLLFLLDVLYSSLLNPMGLRDNQAGLLALLVVGVLAARGLAVALAFNPRIFLIPAVVLPLLQVALALDRQPAADLRAGGVFADRLFRDVPPGAILLASSDHTASACQWLQSAEGVRPDAPCFSLALLRDPRNLRAAEARLHLPGLLEAARAIEANEPPQKRMELLVNPWHDRPVGWEPGSPLEDAAVAPRWQPDWPWTWLAQTPVTELDRAQKVAHWLEIPAQLCGPQLQGCGDRPTLARHLATAAALLGGTRMIPAADQARQLLEFAVLLAPDQPKALNNLAALEIQSAHPQRALDLCEQALEAEPDYARAHRTAAHAALFLHKTDLALAHAEAYVRARPDRETRPWIVEMAREVGPPVDAQLRALLP